MAERLLVKVTCGVDDPERANQGLTVAAAGVAAGASVSLWLTGEAVRFAVAGPEGVVDLGLEHATAAGLLVEAVLGAGSVTVCTQCAARRGIAQADVVQGATISGAASFVEEALADGTQALVY